MRRSTLLILAVYIACIAYFGAAICMLISIDSATAEPTLFNLIGLVMIIIPFFIMHKYLNRK